MSALTNLMIGVSMLLIPVFANSLFNSGLSDSVASGAAIATGAKPLTEGMARLPRKAMGKMWDGAAHAFNGAKEFTQRRFDNARKNRYMQKMRNADPYLSSKGAQALEEKWEKENTKQ